MRIVITHERSLMSVALRHGLERDGGYSIVGEVQGAAATIALVRATDPDVVLLDAGTHGHGMLALLRELHTSCPDVMVVMCSMPSEPELIRLALSSGACACLLKSINPKDIASAIRHAVDRTAYHAVGLPEVDEDDTVRLVGLTRREAQVMRAVARGLSNQEIADELTVTLQTVKSHLVHVYRKLGVSNRTEAARWVFGVGAAIERQPAGRA